MSKEVSFEDEQALTKDIRTVFGSSCGLRRAAPLVLLSHPLLSSSWPRYYSSTSPSSSIIRSKISLTNAAA
ncbi:hypothetical protein Cni_G08983 [Canna indica]|uniref:Uncharacterized protein n=1 Tax=Canna indica TaxID=4628 RepID=A0AAQ3Q970_9LILI|nr:hypothetical protein Cni_G08983 [Canna indica]